jgi:amino acid transporter
MATAAEPGPAGAEAGRGHGFGTFGGVFTPSILTIFGVIMYLRAGFCVGQSGVLGALVILALAELVTALTALSICAISTNTPVGGGGMYYMISRSLGPEFGGAIGLALFFAQALSAPFYVLGFTEALVWTFPALAPHFLTISLTTAGVMFFITWVGAHWAIRVQYVILAILGASILVLLGGAIARWDGGTLAANLRSDYTPASQYGFWVIFAIYFPATTGITAGVSMSGDLRDAKRSLPLGTLLAVGVGALVYGVQIVLMGGAFGREELISQPYQILVDHALFGAGLLVTLGVFAASLSSAIGSFMGAPRVLQALARDDILWILRPFRQGSRKGDEPRVGLWFTVALTVAVLLVAGNNKGGGAFNVVAAVVTMFFLYTYGITNLAAFVESLGANPSFRPSFRLFHWSVALAGAASCALAAFLIDTGAAVGAVILIGGLYIYIRRRELETAFGDARRGFVYSRVRDNLLRLREMPLHSKNWRPTILVLSGSPQKRPALVRFADWLECDRGIITLGTVLSGDFENLIDLRAGELRRLEETLKEQGVPAFPEVVLARDLDEGLRTMLQCHSIGPIKPNIVMLGWPGAERAEAFARNLGIARSLGMSVVVLGRGPTSLRYEDSRVDVWWRGKANGSLMMILSYLLVQNAAWHGSRIRLLRLVGGAAGREPAAANLRALASAARVEADVEVVVDRGGGFKSALDEHSRDAGLVVLGMNVPEPEDARAFHARYEALMEGLGGTLLVYSSGEADLLA